MSFRHRNNPAYGRAEVAQPWKGFHGDPAPGKLAKASSPHHAGCSLAARSRGGLRRRLTSLEVYRGFLWRPSPPLRSASRKGVCEAASSLPFELAAAALLPGQFASCRALRFWRGLRLRLRPRFYPSSSCARLRGRPRLARFCDRDFGLRFRSGRRVRRRIQSCLSTFGAPL